jgi:hypothetical protein
MQPRSRERAAVVDDLEVLGDGTDELH